MRRHAPRRDKTPLDWQLRERERFSLAGKRALYASPRLGKTLQIADALEDVPCERAVISAPGKVCPNWVQTLQRGGYEVLPLYDTTIAKAQRRLESGWSGAVVINHDKLAALAHCFTGNARPVGAFVFDESHHAAGRSSHLGRAYRGIGRRVPWVRALSGTPAPGHYGYLWGQLQFMEPEAWDTSYERWAQRFLVRDAMFPSRVLAHINTDELRAMVNRICSIYRRSDVFGPDQYHYTVRHVDMPERCWKLYHTLVRDWVIDEPDAQVSTDNAAVRIARLQQLTSGYLPGGADGLEQLHSAKVDYLIADLDEIFESREKAIVFHRFDREGKFAYDEIARKYPKVTLIKIDGDQSVAFDEFKRREVTFNSAEGAACAVVQIQAGEGIDLSAAAHAMYLSRTFSFMHYEQSRDRCFKPGMPRFITFYDVPQTVDDFITKALEAKQNVHESITHCDVRALAYGNIWRT